MGLQGMIGEMVMRCDTDLTVHAPASAVAALQGHIRIAAWRALSQAITALENGKARRSRFESGSWPQAAADYEKFQCWASPAPAARARAALTDEFIRRLRLDQGDASAYRCDQHRPQSAQERRRACWATASA